MLLFENSCISSNSLFLQVSVRAGYIPALPGGAPSMCATFDKLNRQRHVTLQLARRHWCPANRVHRITPLDYASYDRIEIALQGHGEGERLTLDITPGFATVYRAAGV